MELAHLKQFLVLAKTQNMREASEILYVSQPHLSRSLKALENELGYPLFDRHKQRLVLNKNGEEVKQCVQRILNEVEKMQRLRISTSERIALNFVSTGMVYYDVLVPMITAELPWYEVHCHTLNTQDEKLQAIRAKEFAIGFGNNDESVLLGPEYESKFLFSDRLCLSVPTKYPLSQKKTIKVEELQDALKDVPVILSSHPESNLSSNLLRRHNIRLSPSYVTNQPLNSRSLTNNDGVVFDPLLLSYFPLTSSRRFIPIEGDDAKFDVYISYRKTEQSYTNTAIEWLIDFFREFNK